MLNLAEFEILNACADHYELFYFPFAEVNYGVVRVGPEDPDRKSFLRSKDEGPWEITVPGKEVTRYMTRLIQSGLLQCWRVSDDPDKSAGTMNPESPASFTYAERIEITEPDEREFAFYGGYDCVTWNEHMQRFGDGPHEFRITEAGVREIHRPIHEELYGE